MRTDRRAGIIERYLDGRMSEAERSAFEMRLLGDAGLQKEVNTEKMIRRTIAHEVAATPREHASGRANLMAALAASPKPPSGSQPGSSADPGALSWLVKTVAALAVAGAIGGAVYVLTDETEQAQQNRPAARTTARPDMLPTDTASVAPPAAQGGARPRETARVAEESPRKSAAAVPSAPPASHDTAMAPQPRTPDSPVRSRRTLPVITPDSVRLPLRVK